ncbi:MAG: phosphoenolpyruvate synthase, partial [Vibrio fluvialis]
MSLEHNATIHEQLALGNTLPKAMAQAPSSYLFVSLSELIAESVFYHPALVSGTDQLSELEKSS